MELQRTLKKTINLKGTGIHTGKQVTLVINPAEADTGILFKRTDLKGQPIVNASAARVVNTSQKPRRTTIGSDGCEVTTIEHILASLSAFGIDNAVIEIDSEELPGFDGSSLPYVEAIKSVGIQELDQPKRYFVVKEPVWISDKNATITVLPSDDFKVSYILSYDHPYIGSQYASFTVTEEVFEKEIAPSRTFCLESEAEELIKQGLGKGADYANTLVVGNEGVINNKLRFEDEFVRHKITDLIGDLYLLGPIKGHVIAVKSGHNLNIKLLKRLYKNQERPRDAGIGAPSLEPIGKMPLDQEQIKKLIPHRHPFLFVDQIKELEIDKYAVGVKNVTKDDYFFAGHFPGHPIMPGVLIVEAMAQVAGILMLAKLENRGKLAYFMAINNVKFRKTVVPGDTLELRADVVRLKSKTGQVRGTAIVDGKVVAEADLMFSLVKE